VIYNTREVVIKMSAMEEIVQISINGMGSTFLGLDLFHCCSLSVYVRNSGNFTDAQNSTSVMISQVLNCIE